MFDKEGYMKKVSIIVPVYNNEKYVEKCITSILSQTYPNIEIIVINDGSTDFSEAILNQYQGKITLINQENHGVSYSRNIGLKKATGDYVMFVDGDDWIDTNMVESLYQASNHGTIDVVRCGYVREYPTKEEPFIITKQIKKIMGNKESIYQGFIKDYRFAASYCQLIRKNCINALFNETIQVGEDYLFNLDLYTNASTFVLLPDTYYHYLYNPNSATTVVNKAKIEKRCQDVFTVYGSLYSYLEKWNINDKKNRKKVSYRVLKELNMKLIACFQTNIITKKEQKELLSIYLRHPLLIVAKQKLSILNILKYIHLYTPFLLCMKMNAQKVYYFLGTTIYHTIYSKRSR